MTRALPSVRRQIQRVVTLACGTTLLLAGGAFLFYDTMTYRARLVERLSAVGDLAAASCRAPLAFQDSVSAMEALTALAALPNVSAARLLAPSGDVLGQYVRDRDASYPTLPAGTDHTFSGDRLLMRKAVMQDGGTLGSLQLVADLSELRDRVVRYASLGGLVFLVLLALAYLFSEWLQRAISDPILRLARAAHRVQTERDYSVRVTTPARSAELRLLTDAFNGMLGDVERRDFELLRAQTELRANLEQLRVEVEEKGRAQEALRRSEEQLIQAQKMEAVGKLAGGVAHDFNNLLTAITGYGQLLLRRLAPESKEHGHAEEILKSADRAAGLTRQLLAFSRKQILAPEVLNLNIVVSHTEKMLRRLIGEDIELHTALNVSLGNIRADRSQVEQVLMNLAVNARDAMPSGGQLMLETSEIWLDLAYCGRHPDAAPGRYGVLTVSDSGTGMDRETEARIFEPFFTTKELGKGTGLGLSTVYGIVRQSGGHITVHSEPGSGTTFRVYFPIVDEALKPAGAEPRTEAPTRGTESILVVEDEQLIRELIRETLGADGYRVRTAANGAEALTLIAAGKVDDVALIVTDVVMPRMNGTELRDAAIRLRPELRVLFMSGYSEAAIVSQGVLQPGIDFIAKPFSPGELSRRVREVLDAAPSRRTA